MLAHQLLLPVMVLEMPTGNFLYRGYAGHINSPLADPDVLLVAKFHAPANILAAHIYGLI